MRLQEMYHLINKSLENWVTPEFNLIDREKSYRQYVCSNQMVVLLELETLRFLPVAKQVMHTLSSEYHFSSTIIQSYSKKQVEEIRSLVKKIQLDLETIMAVFIELHAEENSTGFDVKLPPDIVLSDLSSCTKDLDTIFSKCPILRLESGEIRLRGVDVGSAWLTFSLIGAGAAVAIAILKNLAALVDSALVLRSHLITFKQQVEALKKAENSTEMLESLTAAHKIVLDQLRTETVEKLAASHGILDNEDKKRLDYSLKLLSEWMGRGLEIYSAIDAPSEVKAVFPPLEMQALQQTQPELLMSESEKTDSE